MNHNSTPGNQFKEIVALIEREDFGAAWNMLERLESHHLENLSAVEKGKAHLYAAEILYHFGRYPDALSRANLAIENLKYSDEHTLYGKAKCRRGYIFVSLGQGPKGADDFREARFAFKRIDDKEGELLACNSLARCEFTEGNYHNAKKYLERALTLCLDLGVGERYSFMRPNLGRVLTLMGEFSDAIQCFQIDPISLELQTPANRCNQLGFQGYLFVLSRDFKRARKHLAESHTIAVEHSFTRAISIYHEYVGELAFWQGDYAKAEKHYREAIRIGMEIAPEGDLISQSYRLLAELQVERSQLNEAEESCNRAWTVAEKITERLELGAIQRVRGEIAARRGDADSAKAAFEESIRILGEIGAKYELARAHLQAGEAEAFSNQYRLTNLFAARGLFDRVGVEYWQTRVSAQIKKMVRAQSAADQPVPETAGDDPTQAPFIAVSRPMKKVLELVEKAKDTNMTLLLLGETGVGKDRLARYIHNTSNRADKPFANVSAANYPAELWTSEFFGHAKGAFTGARESKPGILERADGGTVYLNEISDVPLDFQVKMLHFLESGEVCRLGSSNSKKLDIRFIAASNRDLQQEIAAGRFRRDLFYRLNQMPVIIPPLRERRGDIRELAQHFLTRYNYPTNKIQHLLNSPFYELLQTAGWPGNVRQLEYILRRLTVLANGADPGEMIEIAREIMADEGLLAGDDRQQLIKQLTAHNWNQRQTARELGISDTNLRRKMKQMKIIRPSDE